MAGIMGLSARDVDATTAWEFMAQWDGWKSANCAEDGVKPPTPEQHDALMAKHGG